MGNKITARVDADVPKRVLLSGVDLLRPILELYGFGFHLTGNGRSSGGYYASGVFKKTERELELHFRGSLGLVTYHIGKAELEHTTYMRLMNVYGQNRFPGFPNSPEESFLDLKHDLVRFCGDFVSGKGEEFQKLWSRFMSDPDMFKGLPK